MRRAVAAAAALGLAAVAWLVLRDSTGGRALFVHRAAPSFTVLYKAGSIRRVAGELLTLRSRRGTLVVSTLSLPPYEGDVSGVLPIVAENRITALQRRLPGFALTADDRDRVHDAPAYELSFRWRRGLGTDLLVVPSARARSGVLLSLRLRRPAPGLSAAQQSFAFGTARP